MKDTYNFDFTTNEFVMKNGDCEVLQGISALKLWIEKILRTQLGAYSMYNTYGANINDLVIGGTYNHDFAEAELRREIEEALLKNDDIISVDSIEVTHNKKKLDIGIKITTTYGTESEVYSI